ncbi:MAG: alpha/beta hydrolase [Eubacteriales bacterium]
MHLSKIKIDGIPAILWGNPADRMIIATHGSHSSKIDDCIWIFAEEATAKGYQVLSFDLPQHGERVYESDPLMPDQCVRELQTMYAYAAAHSQSVALFGCSMGAYFELLSFANAPIERAWFLSPVTDMERIIHNLMYYCHVTEEELKQRGKVDNDIEPLYYPYYEYVKNNPIVSWMHPTHILRGEQDTLCEGAVVKGFADRFGCELTECRDSKHWFHTDAELEFFRHWIKERL